MNSRLWKRTLIIFIVCFMLVLLFDFLFNGIFVDWFYRIFMINYENGAIEPDWMKLKQIFTIFLLVIIPTGYILSCMLLQKRLIKEQAVIKREVLNLLNEQSSDVTTKYPEIKAEILKIQMDRNNQRELYEKETSRKNDLVTYLAHDLKTPLASIIGYLNFLDDAKDIPKESREKYVRIAMDKAYRLDNLIDQFFEITRFNIQSISLQLEKADLQLLMQQFYEEFYSIAYEMHRTLVFDIKDSIYIYIDSDKFGRVLNNVMKNALAYSFENSTIFVNAYVKEAQLLIEIQNKGNQIPQQQLQNIFEKFYRLDQSRTSSKGGAGLGLAIAKDIMKAHHGDIYVESTQEKTIFTIALPNTPLL